MTFRDILQMARQLRGSVQPSSALPIGTQFRRLHPEQI
jgi:hypothetical protein